MKKFIALIILLPFLIIPTTIYGACQGSSPDWTVASPYDDSDCQDCITAASNGDTINIPAASVTWGTMVTLNKEVSIIGAGIGNTVITGYGFDITDGTDNWRISGIEWQWYAGQGTNNTIEAGSSNSSNGCRSFRIDNCEFNGHDYYPVQIMGQSYGVIDNCSFLECDGGIDFAYGYNATWSVATQLGTVNFVFVEDNMFEITNNEMSHCVMGNQGSRFVFRYNTVEEKTGSGRINDAVDMHGMGHSSGARLSTRAFEIYENTFIKRNSTCCRGIRVRGGTGVIYDNIFNDATTSWSGGEIQFLEERVLDCGVGTSPGLYISSGTYTPGGCSGASMEQVCNGTYYYLDYTGSDPALDETLTGQSSGASAVVDIRAPNNNRVYFSSITSGPFTNGETINRSAGGSVTADGNSQTGNGEGYPCCNQCGRGQNEALEPIYIWNNLDEDAVTVIGVNIDSDCATTFIQENTDYYLSEKPSYSAYTYPHPLRGESDTNVSVSGDCIIISSGTLTIH